METIYDVIRWVLFFVLLYAVIYLAVINALENFYDKKILDYWDKEKEDEETALGI